MNFPSIIFQEAATLMGVPNTPRAFQLTFGLRPEICSEICDEIPFPPGFQAQHLLWALLYLKGTKIPLLSCIVSESEKVVSMWTWRVIPLLQSSEAYNENFLASKTCVFRYRYDLDLNNPGNWMQTRISNASGPDNQMN